MYVYICMYIYIYTYFHEHHHSSNMKSTSQAASLPGPRICARRTDAQAAWSIHLVLEPWEKREGSIHHAIYMSYIYIILCIYIYMTIIIYIYMQY